VKNLYVIILAFAAIGAPQTYTMGLFCSKLGTLGIIYTGYRFWDDARRGREKANSGIETEKKAALNSKFYFERRAAKKADRKLQGTTIKTEHLCKMYKDYFIKASEYAHQFIEDVRKSREV
jgi:hypothetical protein